MRVVKVDDHWALECDGRRYDKGARVDVLDKHKVWCSAQLSKGVYDAGSGDHSVSIHFTLWSEVHNTVLLLPHSWSRIAAPGSRCIDHIPKSLPAVYRQRTPDPRVIPNSIWPLLEAILLTEDAFTDYPDILMVDDTHPALPVMVTWGFFSPWYPAVMARYTDADGQHHVALYGYGWHYAPFYIHLGLWDDLAAVRTALLRLQDSPIYLKWLTVRRVKAGKRRYRVPGERVPPSQQPEQAAASPEVREGGYARIDDVCLLEDRTTRR
jgi:hypothetical protein